MTYAKAWLPFDSIVTVPKAYKFDEENHLMIIEDCGEDALTLKDLVRQGNVSSDLGGNIGTSIGHFLGSLHCWGRNNPDGILGIFKGNEQAIRMSA